MYVCDSTGSARLHTWRFGSTNPTFDSDGDADAVDFGAFRLRFGTGVSPPACRFDTPGPDWFRRTPPHPTEKEMNISGINEHDWNH